MIGTALVVHLYRHCRLIALQIADQAGWQPSPVQATRRLASPSRRASRGPLRVPPRAPASPSAGTAAGDRNTWPPPSAPPHGHWPVLYRRSEVPPAASPPRPDGST